MMGIGGKEICSVLRGSAFRQNLSMMDGGIITICWLSFRGLINSSRSFTHLNLVHLEPDEDSVCEEQLRWTDKWS